MNALPLSRSREPRPGSIAAAVVAALGTAALANLAAARWAERRHPPSGAFIDVDGVRLHYLEKGTGSPVVLLHGNQTMAEDFAISGLIDLLAQRHRVIAFDRPGFGHSDRPRRTVWTSAAQAGLVHQALRQLGVEKPVLLGHSWGGLMALEYALNYPADTSAVLVVSGYYFPRRRLDEAMASVATIPIAGGVLRHTIFPPLGWLAGPAIVKAVFAPSKVPERFRRRFPFSLALRPSQLRAAAGDASLTVSGAAEAAGRYTTLAMPVAIMAGRGDRVVSVDAQAVRLHAVLPHSTLQLIEGVGHMLHYACPERVAATVEALCEEARAGNPPAARQAPAWSESRL